MRAMNRPEAIARRTLPCRRRPPRRGGRIGVLLVNLGTPDATDAASVRRYLQGVSQRRPRDRESRPGLEVRAQRHHPAAPAAAQRPATTRRSGIASATNRRSRPSPARRRRSSAPPPTRSIRRSSSIGACATAIRRWTAASRRWRRPAASASCWCRSIRNMPRRPAPRSATRRLSRWRKLRDQPALRVVPPYYDDQVYIDALAVSIEAELKRLPFKPDLILASFHGIPKSYVDDGDPYPSHCDETVRLLRAAAGLDESKLMLTFQSRFGRAEWLQPYTDKTVEALAQRGVKNLAVVTPGFSADCLETLEEIAVENARYLQSERRREFRRDPVPQRQRGRHGGDLASRAARTARLDLRAVNAPYCWGGWNAEARCLPLAGAVLALLLAATPAVAQSGRRTAPGRRRSRCPRRATRWRSPRSAARSMWSAAASPAKPCR